MNSLIQLALILFLPLSLPQEEPAKEPQGRIMVAKKGTFTAKLTLDGKFVPGEAEEFSFWPKAYAGGLKVLDVKEAGTTVKKGDVLIRFDARSIDEQIAGARLDLRAAAQQLEDALNRVQLAGRDVEVELKTAAQELEFAELKLKGYRDVERALRKDEIALSKLYSEHSIEDQEDELDQLGKMYEEDELTEETEEIVLKRSKRNLDRTKIGFDIQKRRRDYEEAFNEPMTLARMIRDVEARKRQLDKLKLTGEGRLVLAGIDAERAAMKHEKQGKRLGDLEVDRAIMEITSPCDGLVLHADRRLKGNPLKPGKSAGSYEPFLSVAKPGSLGVQFLVPEADLFKVNDGMAVVVKPAVDAEAELEGTITERSTLPDAQNRWACLAEVAGSHERLLPGMSCKLEVVHLEIEEVIVVPKQAVHEKEGKKFCRVLIGDETVERTVVTGESNDKEIVIVEGLEEGERIVL